MFNNKTPFGGVEESLTRPDRFLFYDDRQQWSGTHIDVQPLRPAGFYHPPRRGLARVRGLAGSVWGLACGGTEGLAKPALNTTPP